EVAQPAVDQLARPAGRSRRPVARLHQRDGQAPRDRVERRTGPDDAAADDQDVELGAGEGTEGLLAVPRTECYGCHCTAPGEGSPLGRTVGRRRRPDNRTVPTMSNTFAFARRRLLSTVCTRSQNPGGPGCRSR